jgi:hypothetical protein
MADAEPITAKAPIPSAHLLKRADKVDRREQKIIIATSRLNLPVLTAAQPIFRGKKGRKPNGM